MRHNVCGAGSITRCRRWRCMSNHYMHAHAHVNQLRRARGHRKQQRASYGSAATLTLRSISLHEKGTAAPVGSIGASHWNLGIARSLHVSMHRRSGSKARSSSHTVCGLKAPSRPPGASCGRCCGGIGYLHATQRRSQDAASVAWLCNGGGMQGDLRHPQAAVSNEVLHLSSRQG